MRHSITRNKFSQISGILFWILLWQIIAIVVDNVYIVPSPIMTMKTLSILIGDTRFLTSIGITLLRVFSGFFLSVLLGVFFGVLSGLNKWVHDFTKPLIIVFKSTPVISVILMVSLWVDSDIVPVFIALLMCFPIIWTNTYEGIKQTDKKLLEMAKCFQVTKKDIMSGIYLPSVRPYVVAGITTAIGISWKVTVAAEVISFPKFAIGKRLYSAKIYVETPEVFAWTVVIVLLSFAFEYVIKSYLKKFESPGVAYDKN